MTMRHSQRVGDALQLLSKGLAPFVERELKTAYGDEWIVEVLKADPNAHPGSAKTASLDDAQFLLKTMWQMWNDVFRKVLGQDERTLVSQLRRARNRWAHQEAFSTDDAYRVLDRVQLLLIAVSAEEADQLDEQKQELLRILYEKNGQPKPEPVPATLSEAAMPVRVFSEKLGAGQREAFQAWLGAHIENGFYVNCKGRSMTLHRAGCPHLELDGTGSTVRSEKGCSTSLSELEKWAAARGGSLSPCLTCAPRV